MDPEIWTSSPPRQDLAAVHAFGAGRIRISVDLPAPFSPSSAWISPACDLQIDALQRLDAGKWRLIERISTAGPVCVAIPEPLIAVASARQQAPPGVGVEASINDD